MLAKKKATKEETRAERNIRWIEKHCRIPEGRDVGKPVKLRPFQKKILFKIYDNPHGTRRAIISVGRKNARPCQLSCFCCTYVVLKRDRTRNYSRRHNHEIRQGGCFRWRQNVCGCRRR